MADVTQILNAIERGDPKAAEELLPLVYEELRILAAQKLSHETPSQTLQATALVHEAYIRLVETENQDWKGRAYFFKAAAEAMRRILVEHARRKQSLKHGGMNNKVELPEIELPFQGPSEELLALDEALNLLSQQNQNLAEIIKLYYFAGLTIDHVAAIQGISRLTAGKRLVYARAWLQRELSSK
jgi:RNA polymerase sigma factor (TIGR02999 family)